MGSSAWVKDSGQLGLMRKSGQITALALKKVIKSVRPGITLKELDQIAQSEIERLDGKPSFKTVPGYHWTTCLTLNDEVVHGIPREIKISEGDSLGIDLGAIYKGWHTDAAWTVIAGSNPGREKFLKAGEEALWSAVKQAVQGKKIGDISSAMQEVVQEAGYSVVKSLSGHGVGRSGHEEPEVPTFGEKGRGVKILSGMTLAIEIIYNMGNGVVYQKEDGWTIASKDGSIGGLFEMSVIVGKEKPEVITDWRKV